MTGDQDKTKSDGPGNQDKSESERMQAVVPSGIESDLKKIIEKKPDEIMELMAVGMSTAGNPLHHKMTPEHISQVIEIASKHDERQYDLEKGNQDKDFSERQSIRRYGFFAFLIIAALTVIVLFLFRDKPEILIPVLTGLGGLVGGFLGGWGVGSRKK